MELDLGSDTTSRWRGAEKTANAPHKTARKGLVQTLNIGIARRSGPRDAIASKSEARKIDAAVER